MVFLLLEESDDMEFDKVIRERFSTRNFKQKEISDSIITDILEAGRLAPTAKNIQPQKIYVVKSEEGLNKIDKISPCRYNAPVVLLICSNKDIAWTKNDYSSYEMDATIVATHMILKATDLGINSVWVDMFDNQLAKELFELPSGIEPICLIPLGYKEETCNPSPMHSNRKELSEMVEYI